VFNTQGRESTGARGGGTWCKLVGVAEESRAEFGAAERDEDGEVVHRSSQDRMCRAALSHSSPPSRGQASCSALHGRVTHANSATGVRKLLGTVLESIANECLIHKGGNGEYPQGLWEGHTVQTS